MSTSTRISIIIPTLNEAAGIRSQLSALQSWRQQGHEVIVADGGSQDATAAEAVGLLDQWVEGAQGRAAQMNQGAASASGDLLVFLHADTRLPADAESQLLCFYRESPLLWGRFDVQLTGDHPAFRVIERMMNWRSRWTGIATGDQAIFVRRQQFQASGGFAEQPLMEDVEFSRRLKRKSRPYCIRSCVRTSSRRWEQHGIVRTILLMWWLRLQYFCGVTPARLVRSYRPHSTHQTPSGESL